MSALIPINNVNVAFEVVNNEVFATSLQIAEVFEKNHSHILRTIDNLPNDEFKSQNFAKHSYLDKTGRVLPCYNLTRDGFSLLVMGFTGEKAYKDKYCIIQVKNLKDNKMAEEKALNEAIENQNIVKRVCSELNITQRELAERLDIPPTTISGWANGGMPKMTELALKLMLENESLKAKFKVLKEAQKILNEDNL